MTPLRPSTFIQRALMLLLAVPLLVGLTLAAPGCSKKKKDALDRRLDTICTCFENKNKNCKKQVYSLEKELREKKDLKGAKRAKARIKKCWSSLTVPSFSGKDPYRLTPSP